VVVGSALVQKVEQSLTQHDKITDDIVTLLGEMRAAMDN
jgi:tryptophan synthase alpha subunit